MKIALGQINPTIGAFQKNCQKMLDQIEKAKAKQADLIVFSELSLVGYPPLDLLDKEHFVEDNLNVLTQMAEKIHGIAAIVGYVEKNPAATGKPFLNAAALIQDGKIISKHFKSLLPSYDVFDETRHFEPAKEVHSMMFKSKPLAISICEDIWNDPGFLKRKLYEKDPLEGLLKAKNTILINISSSPFSMGRLGARHNVLKSLSQKHGIACIYVNQVGANDELIFDGGSFAVNEKGDIIGHCARFKEDLIVVDVDRSVGEIRSLPSSEIEAVILALELGIRDYVQKCGFSKVLIGLSGGLDSALTATLAVRALGNEQVTGILMPSRFSSVESRQDAEALSKNLNMKIYTLSIEPLYKAFLETLKPLFSNVGPTLTEENIQARIRGTLLMALSNQWQAMLLSTGNKSELATGYCTLYGDLTGGLAVLSDVPKTMVYEISKFINRTQEVIPANCLVKPPSAELRPNQKDEDSLPPYSTLDKILKAYIEEHLSVSKIIQQGLDPQVSKEVVERIDRNEYKRRQAPPGLRITTKAFGMGRRLPITQRYQNSY
ncbi:MAG: NAD+ synthase [Deltaproteobacteria bacterium]|nr:NAD+ synthase [Deltaproteobacteria bacterium]